MTRQVREQRVGGKEDTRTHFGLQVVFDNGFPLVAGSLLVFPEGFVFGGHGCSSPAAHGLIPTETLSKRWQNGGEDSLEKCLSLLQDLARVKSKTREEILDLWYTRTKDTGRVLVASVNNPADDKQVVAIVIILSLKNKS